MPHQQQKPSRSGLPPVLTSFTIFVFNPIATIAHMIKNLLSSLIGSKTSDETPRFVAIVVMTEAPRKKRMKNGNTFENLKVVPSAFSFFVLHQFKSIA